MKKLLSLAAALALTAAVLSCSMVVVRASDHYGWQEGEPTPVGGFPATPTPVPVTTSFIEPNYYPTMTESPRPKRPKQPPRPTPVPSSRSSRWPPLRWAPSPSL